MVARTQKQLAAEGRTPVRYSAFFCVRSRTNLLLVIIYGSIFRFLALRSWGRRLLLAFPGLFSWGIFSREGPTEAHLKATSFQMLFIGHGYSSGESSSQASSLDCENSQNRY